MKPTAAPPEAKAATEANPLRAVIVGFFVLTFGLACMLGLGEGVEACLLTTILLSGAAGYQAVWGVARALRTPLLSVTNAISGMTAVGCLLMMQLSVEAPGVEYLGMLAVRATALNIIGSFVVSQRMLTSSRSQEARITPR